MTPPAKSQVLAFVLALGLVVFAAVTVLDGGDEPIRCADLEVCPHRVEDPSPEVALLLERLPSIPASVPDGATCAEASQGEHAVSVCVVEAGVDSIVVHAASADGFTIRSSDDDWALSVATEGTAELVSGHVRQLEVSDETGEVFATFGFDE